MPKSLKSAMLILLAVLFWSAIFMGIYLNVVGHAFKAPLKESAISVNEVQVGQSQAIASKKTSYIFANSRIAEISDNKISYYHDDNLGSHSLITDSTGNVQSEFSSYPFGETMSSSNSHYQYTGKENDKETGLYYYGARYYNPYLGRFTQVDPKLLIDTNFAYVKNNPFNYVDPDGRSAKDIKDALLLPLRLAAYQIGAGGGHPRRTLYESKELLLGHDPTGMGIGERYNGLNSYKQNSPNILAIYLGLAPNNLPESEYQPTSLTKYKDIKLYSIKEWSRVSQISQGNMWQNELLQEIIKMKKGDIINQGELEALNRNAMPIWIEVDVGRITVSIGKDEKGPYFSVFDVWDFAGDYTSKYELSGLQKIEPVLMQLIGNPIGIYDRYYLNDQDIKTELERRSSQDAQISNK